MRTTRATARSVAAFTAAALALALLTAACQPPGEGPAAASDGGLRPGPAAAGAATAQNDRDAAAAEPITLELDVATDLEAVPTSTPGSYLAGLHAERMGESEAAADFMLYALEQDPDNVDLLQRAFLLVLGDGREAEAFRLAERLVEKLPKAPLPALALIVRDMRAGRDDSALRRLGDLSDSGLSKFLSPLVRAWVLAGQGNVDVAVASLDPLGESSGFAVLRDMHAGLINDMAGNTDEAVENLRAVLAASETPSLRLIQALGRIYERTGRPDEARALYDRYMEENPDSVLLEDAFARLESGKTSAPLVASAAEGVAEALFNLASTLHQQGVSKVALSYGRLALVLKPDFAVCQALVADVLDSLGRTDEAVAVYKTIDPDSPFHWLARMRVAISLDAQGRTDDALAEIEKMADDRTDRADALITKGDILRSHERFEEAIEAYDRAVARIPELKERHWSLLYARGISLERTGDWAPAETDFLKALELRPDQPYVLNYLGYSWVEQGVNLDRARHMLERAVELMPNDGFIVDSLGWVLFRLGLYDEAVERLERAVELEPQDPTINDHLGDALWKVGRKNEARFQWRRALSLKPDPDLVAEIEAKLEGGLEITRADKPGS